MQFRRRSQPGTKSPALRTREPKKGRRWRRFFFRTSVRLLVLFVLLLAGLAMAVWFGDWSMPWLDRRIQASWTEATGLPLTYAKATFEPSDSRIVFEKPVITDPESGLQLIELDRMTLSLSFLDALFGETPLLINDLSLDGRLPLSLAIDQRRLRVEDPWHRIIELIAARVKSARQQDDLDGAPPVIFDKIHLSRGDLTLYEVREQQRQPLASMTGTVFDLSFNQSIEPHQILIDGRLNSQEHDRPLMIAIQPDFAHRQAHLSLRFHQFDSQLDLPFDLPFTAQADSLELKGLVQLTEEGIIHSSGGSSIDKVDLKSARLPLNRSLGAVGLNWNIDYALATRNLDVKALNLSSRYGGVAGHGSIVLEPPYAYDLTIEPIEITTDGVALVKDLLPSDIKILNEAGAHAVLQGTLRGMASEPYPRSVQCDLGLGGLDIQTPVLPAPLEKISLQARLTTDSLTVEKASGILQGIPMDIKGKVVGQIFAQTIEEIELQWVAVGQIEGLTPLLDEKIAKGFEVSGEVSGEGRMVAVGPFRRGLFNALTQVRMDGEVRLNGGRIAHPAMGPPIQNLGGRIKIGPTEASFSGLMGQYGELRFDLDGRITGAPRFWDQAQYEMSGRLNFEIAELLSWVRTYARSHTESLEALTDIRGRGNLSFSAEGMATAWDMTRFNGNLRLENLLMDLPGEMARGPLSIEEVVFGFDRKMLNLEKLTGALGDLSATGKGSVTPAGGELALTLDGPLQSFKDQIPALLHYFNVDGRARIEHNLILKDISGNPAQDWFELALDQRFRPRQGERLAGWFQRLWATDNKGLIDMEDGEMTFRSMPTRLRHITGSAFYDQEHLWMTEKASVEGGEGSRDLAGTAELIYGRGKPVVLRFDVTGGHFPLQKWLGPWHRPDQDETDEGEDRPRWRGEDFDPSLTSNFQIRGSVKSNSFDMLGLQGGDFQALLDVDLYTDQSDHVRWHDMKASLYGGQAAMEGDLFEDRMQSDLTFDNLSMPPLITDLTGEKTGGQGLFSGNLGGRMRIERQMGHPDNPFKGQGHINITGSRFVSNRVFRNLGGILKLPIFEDISFSKIEGPFQFEGPRLSTEGLVFNSPVMDLKASGTAGPAKQLDFVLQIEFLRVVDSVPLVGTAMNLINRLAGKLFSFKVTGAFDDPRISVL